MDCLMPHQGLVTLPPTRIDVAISKSCICVATPGRERTLRAMTWLADEKILLGVVGLFWLNARIRAHREAACAMAYLLCRVRHEPRRWFQLAARAYRAPRRSGPS